MFHRDRLTPIVRPAYCVKFRRPIAVTASSSCAIATTAKPLLNPVPESLAISTLSTGPNLANIACRSSSETVDGIFPTCSFVLISPPDECRSEDGGYGHWRPLMLNMRVSLSDYCTRSGGGLIRRGPRILKIILWQCRDLCAFCLLTRHLALYSTELVSALFTMHSISTFPQKSLP
jgi:hypothetical protein